MFGLVDGNNFFVSCERVFDRSLVGRPVAVLSNNDGCCVSRSNEFKALGIAMGTPYFQLKQREAAGELCFRSSNYELYGDLSRRIVTILRDEAFEVEQYSIDEAFIVPPNLEGRGNREEGTGNPYLAYGQRLRNKILRWVGIPCGIGFGPTKTLAKIANHIAKKSASGVYLLPDDPTEILATLPAVEVWGVGRRLPAKLRAMGIFTAKNLRDAPDDTLRAIGGVTLLRTAMELRGISCHEERDYDADPDSVSCSRSFGDPATTQDAIEESIATFTGQAAVKLRKHGLLASGCNIYAQVFASGGGGEYAGRTVVFPHPTDATNEMLTAIRREVGALFVQGRRYRKTGVIFFGLEKADAPKQLDLFDNSATSNATPSRSSLYKVVDALNARFGKGAVFSAAEGVGERAWRMKREKLSARPTTRWNELLVVR
jgi:DNA polymerase V